jgi:hypothetical protein
VSRWRNPLPLRKIPWFLPNETDTVLSYPIPTVLQAMRAMPRSIARPPGHFWAQCGIFAPQETATRAEVATIIQRLIKSVIDRLLLIAQPASAISTYRWILWKNWVTAKNTRYGKEMQ